MSILQAILMGVIQGVTEFLPISSSGHLIIFPKVFGWEEQPLVFDTTLHLSTGLALIVCFWKDICDIFKSFFKDISKYRNSLNHYSSESMLGLKIIVGSIPIGLVGYFFGDFMESGFRNIFSVAVFLIFGSFLMYMGEKKLKRKLLVKDEISLSKSFKVGLFQVLSLLPGVSRSGSTISGGMIFGLSRKEATRFSFLLSIPAVLAAGILRLYLSFDYLNMADFIPMVFGAISSFIVGIISIKFMLKFVRNNKLYPFIFYRLALAGFLIVISIFS